MINFNQYKVLTFDCYGTLIDWESGILAAFKQFLTKHKQNLDDETILQLFAQFESEIQKGEYLTYKEVLRKVVERFGEQFGFAPNSEELYSLSNSIKNWLPFPDTVEALKSLKHHFKLAIISNVDDNLFADSTKHLKVDFDWIITAEQVKSYKPALNNFKAAIHRIGIPKEQILHVACSVYHDIIPAQSLGISTVWVNRRTGKDGAGANLPVFAQADLEVPNLQTLANLSMNK
ncbi:haloacid dehalogenase, type II [Tolypothrix tenuis PCC 7101]|uniref:Haloacid dehalogenase, type II n=1 Tax=Tolypothrix tenuis PCC 7101 TaxID=231146 RepID=A0A1Z4MSL2_9CYAN|nr:haloacid dehalogenase type II [Aulosira sp. FACHB-113]BAY96458.1 haloacid dehalogenase, type II [Tolypothrix tenuis PCC 7101]BAZ73034.1 haloacid dehalogenase, type II [Aulosira laxa NIES-50]